MEDDLYSAVEYYREALTVNPKYADAWYNLALCSYHLGNYDLALTYAEKALSFSKDLVEILNLKGLCFIAQGKLNDARSIFNQVLNSYPNNLESRFGLAQLDLYDGKLSSAESLYKEALKRDEVNQKALLSLALISSEQKKYKIAEEYINQAVSYYNGDKDVHYLAAYLACQRGDFAEAELRARSAVSIDGNYDKAYSLLSGILYEQKRYSEVIDIQEFRINRNRNLLDAWYILGLSYYKLNEIDKAVESFELGLAINPEDEVMRLCFEQIVNDYISLEDERRDEWAFYHLDKSKEFNRIYDGISQRYELQKAISLAPFNVQIRQDFATLLEREGLYEFYLEQLKFIEKLQEDKIEYENSVQVNENSPKKILTSQQIKNQDAIESLSSLLKDNLSSKWSVNPFYLEKSRWNIGIYYEKKNVQLIHSDLEEIIARACKDSFQSVSSVSVDIENFAVDGFGQAYKIARQSDRDYFVIINVEESERTCALTADIYSARTGTKISSSKINKTGNDRFAKVLRSVRRAILEILPIRGKIIASVQNTLLVDLGKSDGVFSGAEFDVVKKSSIITNDSSVGVHYDVKNILGKLKITVANEEISEGLYSKKGFYDTMNIGDEIVLVKSGIISNAEDGNVALDLRPAADANGSPIIENLNENLKENIKEDLKAQFMESELIRLIRDLI